jgi:hypothetical protein
MIKVKDRLMSGHTIVESHAGFSAGKVVIWTGTDIAAFDSTNSDHGKKWMGIVIERFDLKHSIANFGVFPLNIANGTYYSDSSGNLTTTVTGQEMGVVTSGQMKITFIPSSISEADLYLHGGCCC